MKRGTKILMLTVTPLVAAAVISTLSMVKPLLRSSAAQVIYSVDEDFKDNGIVFRPLFGRDVYYLYLPDVNVLYRWWIIDFANEAISVPHAPQSLLSIPYVSRNEPFGTSIGNEAKMGAWSWIFTASRVSFAGRDFISTVQRIRDDNAGNGSRTVR